MVSIIDKIKANEIRWLKIQLLDVDGYMRGFTLNAEMLSDKKIKEGLTHPFVAETFGEEGKVRFIEKSYSIIPWEERGGRILGYVEKTNGEAIEKDPYHSLLRAMRGLEALGLELYMSNDVEFYLFENVTVERVYEKKAQTVIFDGREFPTNPTARYTENRNNISLPFDMYSIIREQIGDVLFNYFNTPILYNYHSKGIGQQRLKTPISTLETAIIDFINIKFVSKMVSMLNGSVATFMPYPIYNENPNSWRIEITIKKSNNKVDEDNLLYFAGGIYEHIESLSIFTNPNTNSYKRIKKMGMNYIISTHKNNAAIEVVKEETLKIKLNFPDPSANPYIALAAIIGAGIDGIKNHHTPDIVEENLKQLQPKDRKKIMKNPPTSPSEAISYLNRDNKYIKGILSPELLAIYLEHRLIEEKENFSRPTPYEVKKYFDI